MRWTAYVSGVGLLLASMVSVAPAQMPRPVTSGVPRSSGGTFYTPYSASPPCATPPAPHGTTVIPPGSAMPGTPMPSDPMAPGTSMPAMTAPGAAAAAAADPGTGAGGERGSDALASAAPNMVGDTQAGACASAMFEGRVTALVDHPIFACTKAKIAENNSPIPRDRVYFTYQFFDRTNSLFVSNTDTGASASATASIHKYTFGAEKAFLDGLFSLEVRIPFATQLNNNLVVDSTTPFITGDSTTQFSNVSFAVKALLCQSETLKISGGLLVSTPTGDDVRVRDVEADTDGLGLPIAIDNRFHYHNRAVTLSPFLGALVTPGDRFFAQGFLQFDYNPNSNRIDFVPMTNGVVADPLVFHLREQSLLRFDLGAGYWIYRNPGSGISGVAPMIEVHYTTALNDAKVATFDRGPDNPVVLGNSENSNLNIWNLLFGSTVELSDQATLAAAAVIPLSSGANKPFDWELNIQLNWRFGAPRNY